MAEFDTIQVTNPLNENFEFRFNGELYTLKAKDTQEWMRALAFHCAKHLSSKLLVPEIKKLKDKRIKDKIENPFLPEVTLLTAYDNPKRRIALYKILQDKTLVQQCIDKYPFKSFVGDIGEYDSFVAKELAGKEKS